MTTMAKAKTWDEAINAGKLGLPQVDNVPLYCSEVFFNTSEFGHYAELTGKIEAGPHEGFEFGKPGTRLFISKGYIVSRLQEQLRQVPCRLQFALGEHPEDPERSMWRIVMIGYPRPPKS